MKMDFIDVRRAYFHADAIRDLYVELPPEDHTPGMLRPFLAAVESLGTGCAGPDHRLLERVPRVHIGAVADLECLVPHAGRSYSTVVRNFPLWERKPSGLS